MKFFFRALWFCSVAMACTVFLSTQKGWMNRATYVTRLAGGPNLQQPSQSTAEISATGSVRSLIVPEHNESSYHWLMQSHQAARENRWVLATVDYDNAPAGRAVRSASLYRWWLELLAALDRGVFHSSLERSLERAALIADPLILLLGLTALAVLAVRALGGAAGLVLIAGGVSLFPLASSFLPGAPDTRGLVALLVLSSAVLLAAGCQRWNPAPAAPDNGPRSLSFQSGWFASAGVTCALLCWINLNAGIAFIASAIAGVFVSRIWMRDEWFNSRQWLAWRVWAVTGGATALAAYAIDFLPRDAGLRLDNLHPIHALAWVGSVELLLIWSWRSRHPGWRATVARWLIGAILAIPLIVLCWLQMTGTGGAPEKDLLWAKLTNLPGGVIAPDFWAWWKRDGAAAPMWAALLPLLLLPISLWSYGRGTRDVAQRSQLGLLLATIVVFAVLASRQLGWWCNLDAVLLALAAAAVARRSTPWPRRAAIGAVVCAAGALGWLQLRPTEPVGPSMTITAAETTQLVERDLAHWLAERFDEKGLTIFAPPRETTALCYYGGFKGIGTFAPENRAGFGTALSIVGAATMEEVEALVRAREIRCVVLPTWDPFLEDFARLYLAENYSNRSSLLVRELRNWNVPLWLRPMAYQMPAIPGFERQGVLVFEVVEPQTPALAASRTAECLAELGDLARAKLMADGLRRFPGDVGALAARVNVALAVDDRSALEETAAMLKTRVQTRADRYLAWDRRVSLAVALAQSNALELAKEQVTQCLGEADEKKVRGLSTGALYRLLVLAKTFELDFSKPGLRDLSVRLLPTEARAQL